jgi:small subunit ribosomal protein S17
MAEQEAMAETETAAIPVAPPAGRRGKRQVKVGQVVSDKMDKTVVVMVANTVMHPLYQRYVKRTSKFHAHDEGNECGVGDLVEIVSCRPLSKRKRWRVRQVLRRAE